MADRQTHTLIIGASISGLACAASLKKRDLDYLIIEKKSQIADPWRNHYERLHLHTSKNCSNLPFKKFGRMIPRYPSRQQVLDYLEEYRAAFNIHPIFNAEAVSVRKESDQWITETNKERIQSKYLVMATGPFSKPRPIEFKGIESFPGKIFHSYQYKTGRDFKGQNVLLVGFGNSACEIAIDLHEQGAFPSMAVRSPVNVVPLDVLGIPVLELSLLMKRLPPRLADRISAPIMNSMIGDLEKLGLRKMPYGPLESIERDARVPVLDIGTIRLIREGHIRIFGNIDHIDSQTIHFVDGQAKHFDAIVAAIGYYRDYAEFLHVDKSRFEDLLLPVKKQRFFGKDGLYFCGYWISPTGQIREIALDAQKIAMDIAKEENLFGN
ncbi:MAG: flavin-containing monooxygenase [Chitinophagales bacterium]